MSKFKLTVLIKVAAEVDVSPGIMFPSLEEALLFVHTMTDPTKYPTMPHRGKVRGIGFTISRVEDDTPTGGTKH